MGQVHADLRLADSPYGRFTAQVKSPPLVLYLGVPDVTATLELKDPEGNAMGLVEMDGDRVKIP